MNIAGGRSWSPQIIVFSIILHAVVLYAIAVAFKVVPPPIGTDEPPVITMVRYVPPPPLQPVDPVPIKQREFNPRLPKAPTVTPIVPPIPVAPTVGPVPPGPSSISVNTPIQEQPISNARIPYPQRAEAQQVEGRVVLAITIMPDGSVRDVRVVNAKPSGYFEDAAVQSVARWRYRPSNVIRTNVLVEIDFVLT